MEIILSIINFILHIDTHLGEIILEYGTTSYVILFLIIFAETGFVFTPFLPGDSLLFAAGAFAALGSFNIFLILLVLWIAAFLGDTANYWIGHFFGQKIIDSPKIPFINKEHIGKAEEFYKNMVVKPYFCLVLYLLLEPLHRLLQELGKCIMEILLNIIYPEDLYGFLDLHF